MANFLDPSTGPEATLSKSTCKRLACVKAAAGAAARKAHSVIFWMGGSERGSWSRLDRVTKAEADATRAEIMRGGRVAHVLPSEQLDRLGMPDGPPTAKELDAVVAWSTRTAQEVQA